MCKETLYTYLNHPHISVKTVCDAVCGELFQDTEKRVKMSKSLQDWSRSKELNNRCSFDSKVFSNYDFERIWDKIEETRFYVQKIETELQDYENTSRFCSKAN